MNSISMNTFLSLRGIIYGIWSYENLLGINEVVIASISNGIIKFHKKGTGFSSCSECSLIDIIGLDPHSEGSFCKFCRGSTPFKLTNYRIGLFMSLYIMNKIHENKFRLYVNNNINPIAI